MDWDEFSEGAIAAGKFIAALVGVCAGAIVSFMWITMPIMLALFTGALDSITNGPGEEFRTCMWWTIIFCSHIAIYAYGLGLVIKKGPKLLKTVLKVVDDDSP